MTVEHPDQISYLMNAPFEMPYVRPGSAVAWFNTGERKRDAEIAFVIKINGSRRSLTIRTANGKVLMSCPHANDPRLQINADQRLDGAWDFTDEHKALEKERQLLTDRVSRLEEMVAKLTAGSQKPAAKQKPGLAEWGKLRSKAQELGIENPTRMKKADLKAAVQEKLEQLRHDEAQNENAHAN